MLKWWVVMVVILSVIVAVGCAAAFGFGGKKSAKNWRTEVEWIGESADRHALRPGDYGRKIEVDGRSRFYEMHIPSSFKASRPTPVVLVFHGGGSDPGAVRYESGMDRTADREGFIVVYPGGTNKRLLIKDRMLMWNDGRPFKDGSYSKVDDINFVKAVLDDLSRMVSIDVKRVYACGYSNGAQFSYRLAKRLSSRIAAIAAVAGHRPVNDSFDPKPVRPISVMQFSGKQDRIGPYYGGEPAFDADLKTKLLPVETTIQSWVSFNGCSSEPAEVNKTGNATKKRYGPCQNGTEVVFWILEDGGHTWPGGRVLPIAAVEKMGLGNINRDIRASDLMWEFFRNNYLK